MAHLGHRRRDRWSARRSTHLLELRLDGARWAEDGALAELDQWWATGGADARTGDPAPRRA